MVESLNYLAVLGEVFKHGYLSYPVLRNLVTPKLRTRSDRLKLRETEFFGKTPFLPSDNEHFDRLLLVRSRGQDVCRNRRAASPDILGERNFDSIDLCRPCFASQLHCRFYNLIQSGCSDGMSASL